MATAAAHRKKDIYGEKPLARTVAEQQAIVKAVEANNIIWQTGSWQRSVPNFHKAAEIVRNGLIGTVTHVEVGLPAGHYDFAGTKQALLAKLATLPSKVTDPALVVPGTPEWDLAVTDPPQGFDFDTWIGPSKMEPYIEARVPKNWRWNLNTGGGQLMDWIGLRRFPGVQRCVEYRRNLQHHLHLSQGSDSLCWRCNNHNCGRPSGHQHGDQVDWKRRLGMG